MRRDFESFRTPSNSLKCALFWVSVAKIRSDPLKKRHILVVRRSTSGFFRSFSWAFADFLAPLTIFHQKMSTFNARFARSYMSGKCRLLNIISDFALLLFPKSAQIWRLTWEALLGLVPFKERYSQRTAPQSSRFSQHQAIVDNDANLKISRRRHVG